MPHTFDDTVALVTGGNRGLGWAIAKDLLARGAKVYVGSRRTDGVDVPGARVIPLDVTNPADVQAVPALVPDLSLLVNNAGVYLPAGIDGPDAVEAVREAVSVNALGMLAVTIAVQDLLVQRGGQVVNILSAACWTHEPPNLAYGASKAAALSISNTLRAALGPRGVQVTSVHPDFIDTDMTATVDIDKVSPEEVSRLTLDALANGEQEVLIGSLPRWAKNAAYEPVPRFGDDRGVRA